MSSCRRIGGEKQHDQLGEKPLNRFHGYILSSLPDVPIVSASVSRQPMSPSREQTGEALTRILGTRDDAGVITPETESLMKTNRGLISLDHTKSLLEEINAAISGYDPVLREKARDILLARAFGHVTATDAPSRANDHYPLSPLPDSSKIALKNLIDAWSPTTQHERALLSAYYLQQIRGYRELSGRQIQDNLKIYGLRVTNVTVAIRENVKMKRPRMMQTKVPGNTRNHYTITKAGIEYVEDMLNAFGMDGNT